MADSPDDALFARVMQLMTSAEAVTAVAAELSRSVDGTVIPEPIAAQVSRVASLAAPGLTEASNDTKRAALGAIRAFFRQASDLLTEPTRAPGWTYRDASVLNEQGRASGANGPILAAVLEREGPPPSGPRRFLDVGTGAGWLAIALARAIPGAEIVGIDIWPPSIECARQNVSAEELGDRVRIVEKNVLDLGADTAFDAVWLPGPFLPHAVVEPALSRVRAALRPGGLVLFGVFAGPEVELVRAVANLRTVRAGGHPFETAEVAGMLTQAGFRDVHEVERTWRAPLRLIVGSA